VFTGVGMTCDAADDAAAQCALVALLSCSNNTSKVGVCDTLCCVIMQQHFHCVLCLLCHYCIFSVNCVISVCLQYFDTVGWVLRPVKKPSPV